MLYLPRGTVHHAAAQEVDSAHLTISTYQRWTHADLMQVWGHADLMHCGHEHAQRSIRQNVPVATIFLQEACKLCRPCLFPPP